MTAATAATTFIPPIFIIITVSISSSPNMFNDTDMEWQRVQKQEEHFQKWKV
jgi:hypothetical protein